ncbi:MAG: HAD-IB family phosphatase [Anaerolineae bacterium]|nr:HAD-IB family phosphatase [Anaerolineae bacterium]
MRWPPYQHIFFDCDSTLTTVEGIDMLAEHKGKKWRVEVLTKAAMDGDLDLQEVYGKRLQAVKPTRQQIHDIRQVYKQHIVEDAAALITTLQFLGHQVYIISGGLAEPVIEFGLYLGVPRENIRAVGVEYNQLTGDWWQLLPDTTPGGRYLSYEQGSLTISDGKAQVVQELMAGKRGRALLIGDGTSDLLAARALDLFVGYGGVVTRPRVQQEAPIFIQTASLAPLLAIAAGPEVFLRLQNSPYEPLSRKAQQLISQGAIKFNHERLSTKFHAAYQTIHPWANRSPA